MQKLAPLVLLSFLSTQAIAGNVKWFAKDAGVVEIAQTVEVPLLRGDVADHRPLVQARVEGDKKRSRLVVIDLAHGWTRIDYATVRELGLTPTETEFDKSYAQTVILPAVRVGELVLRDVKAEVVAEGPMVLGLAGIDGLASAILPSSGTVRFVPANEGRALVESVGVPLDLRRQSAKRFKAGSKKLRGNGLAVSVPGAMAGQDGWMGIRTAEARSRVTGAFDVSGAKRVGRETHLRGRGRIGDDENLLELPEGWVVRDEALVDPDKGFLGTLGYDQLHGVDLAFSPDDGLVAAKRVFQPKWTRAEEARLELARKRWKGVGLDERAASSEAPPRMGFGAAEGPASGDPGDPKKAGVASELADALWEMGELEESIRVQLVASELAGDHCGPKMELGERRLAWSGSMQKQSFIVELIRQPLREAGSLWDRWEAVPAARQAVILREGKAPEGVFSVPQSRRCFSAWGTLMAAFVAQNNTEESSQIYREHYGRDPLVSYAQGLSLLAQGQPKTAEIPIREAITLGGANDGDLNLGLGWALVGQDDREKVRSLIEEVPGLDTDHGLTTAMIVAEWGQVLGGEEDPAALVSALVRSDQHWIPAQLMAVWKGVEEANADRLAAELIRQHQRDAGAMDVEVYRAVLDGLNGDTEGAMKQLDDLLNAHPPTADLFAGMALLASVSGDEERKTVALEELRLRFPTVPFDDLGLKP